MPADDLMDDFPPAPDRLVTLSNWRKAPFSAWGFRNVRRLIPTADIAAGGDTAGLPKCLGKMGHVGFSGQNGQPTTPRHALRATRTHALLALPRRRISAPRDTNRPEAPDPPNAL